MYIYTKNIYKYYLNRYAEDEFKSLVVYKKKLYMLIDNIYIA